VGQTNRVTIRNAPSDRAVAPELRGIAGWLNSAPLTLAELREKVVLVWFWTFACVNCQNVRPYVKRWDERYRDRGLVVIGVHTPEFAFEKDPANVQEQVQRSGITFPVALDPDFATWDAYRNRYWPAFYFIDRKGRVRHTQFGEGQYDRAESVIEELLAEPA
jgi:thiol-disulfide isomerase/thioredoxin